MADSKVCMLVNPRCAWGVRGVTVVCLFVCLSVNHFSPGSLVSSCTWYTTLNKMNPQLCVDDNVCTYICLYLWMYCMWTDCWEFLVTLVYKVCSKVLDNLTQTGSVT